MNMNKRTILKRRIGEGIKKNTKSYQRNSNKVKKKLKYLDLLINHPKSHQLKGH